MDGIHDLGGKDGFGPVEPEPNEPVFHHDWEGRVFVMAEVLGTNGTIPNIDAFRHSVERIDPVVYLTGGYYGRWLAGIEGFLHEHSVIAIDEMQSLIKAKGADASPVRIAALNPPWQGDTETPADAEDCRRPTTAAAKFAVGQSVRTIQRSYPGHTRLPQYARGKCGVIHKLHGGWVYPDTNAHGLGENPQYLYTVAFKGDALWGEDCEANTVIFLDLFEPYLEAN